MIRRMLIALMVSTVSLSVAAADYDPPLLERTGAVQEVVPALNDVVIYGERFTVSYTAEIEIGSTYGAYSMLRPEMRVFFRYQLYDDGRKVIVYLRELAASESVDEV